MQLLSPVAVEAALEWKGLAGTYHYVSCLWRARHWRHVFDHHRQTHATGALTVPLCLAVATGLWVWVLPETKGIELPTLKPHPSPLPVVLAEPEKKELEEAK